MNGENVTRRLAPVCRLMAKRLFSLLDALSEDLTGLAYDDNVLRIGRSIVLAASGLLKNGFWKPVRYLRPSPIEGARHSNQ